MTSEIKVFTSELIACLSILSIEERVEALNYVRKELHEVSPFKEEPVDLVQWVKSDTVSGNSYNPNSVAPIEMALLHVSVQHDHFTMPIVSMVNEDGLTRTIVDGKHRSRVGTEYPDIVERIHGYLPVSTINEKSKDISNRMAATVRHNRARGTHAVDKMSDIVLDLKKRNWSDEKIAKNLGMDADEVLRLGQISGLAEMFAHREFSEAWESEGEEVENELIIEE